MDIVKIPNKILTKKLKEVSMADIKSGSLKELFLEMKKDMVAHNGVGLAGNQIGKDLAVFVIDENIAKEAGMSDVYINPEITEYSKDTDDMEEGCLSIKEYYVPIRRSKKIKIKFMDEFGNKLKIKAKGFLARVLQHETDHLNGLTIKGRVGK